MNTQNTSQQTQLPVERFTELEKAQIETCQVKRAMIQANRTTLSLMERENDDRENSLISAAVARIELEDKLAAEATKVIESATT